MPELSPSGIDIVEDRQYFRFDNNNIALLDIHNVLELENPLENREKLFVVVLSDRLNAYGLAVDKFLGNVIWWCGLWTPDWARFRYQFGGCDAGRCTRFDF